METQEQRNTRWAAEAEIRRLAHEAKKAELDALVASGKLEWHCQDRHGVVRGLRRSTGEMNRVVELLNYFYGKQIWRSHRDLEFVKSGSKPWRWCGETVLFKDWQDEEIKTEEARSRFRTGQRVRFTYKNRSYVGLISGINRRCTVVVEGEGVFYISPLHLVYA